MHALEIVTRDFRFHRSVNARTLRLAANRQKGECTWCGGQVGRGRRAWCSDACVHQFRYRCDPAYVRSLIERFARRPNVRLHCEACRVDVIRRSQFMAWLDRRIRRHGRTGLHTRVKAGAWLQNRAGRRWHRRNERLRTLWCLRHRWFPSQSTWELDHVVPVCEGGGCCGPEGLRVLCRACHLHETGLLAVRLGRKRRSEARGS